MPLDWDNEAMAEGLRCYRNREFFETHEHWEAEWLRAAEPDKTFLQALIQIAAAFHHFGRENRVGATSLLRASLRKLDLYPSAFDGLNVEAIRQSLRAWLSALDAGEPSPILPFPPIR
jgi:predicted metal-dependent hydrolase